MRNVLARGERATVARFLDGRVLLAFDFDGTLAAIVRDPARAGLRATTRRWLGQLAAVGPCVVISGRARADVTARLEGLGVRAVIGNHGLERGPAPAAWRRLVAAWREDLAAVVAAQPGVVLEDKRLSLALHYRRAPDRARARRAILRAVARLPRARVLGGKAVVNVLPDRSGHKGAALEREMRRLGCPRALYVGDDQTDEDVFRLARQERLLTVRVGRSARSAATYCLRSQGQVDALLALLVELRGSAAAPCGPAGRGPQERRRGRRGPGSLSKKGASTPRVAVSRTR